MKIKKIIGTKLKNIRSKNDLTIQQLSQMSSVSSNMISRIERGLTIPSVEILLKIATVFDKSINYFVEEVSSTNEVVFTKSGTGPKTVYDDRKMVTESFTACLRDPQFMSFACTVTAGASSGVRDMYHPGDELIYIIDGRMKFEIADEEFTLLPGDSLCFKSHLPHSWTNIGNTDARVIWTLSPFTTI